MSETALPAQPSTPSLKWPILGAVVALLLAAGAGFALRPHAPPPPVLGQLPAFSLTDAHGKPFDLQTMAGKVWVADFIFTRCPTLCPLLTQKMQGVQKRAAGTGLEFVSISVDPTYDTPAVLTQYLEKRHLDASNWHFVTGPTDAAVQQVVVDGFKDVMERQGGHGPKDFFSIAHSGHLVLVDGKGQLRGYYDAKDPTEVDALLRDARTLLRG